MKKILEKKNILNLEKGVVVNFYIFRFNSVNFFCSFLKSFRIGWTVTSKKNKKLDGFLFGKLETLPRGKNKKKI